MKIPCFPAGRPANPIILLGAGILLLLSCAHQVPPSGGIEDKIGPSVMEAHPAPLSVKVDTLSRITIIFSEWIAKTAAQRSVSLLPPLDGGVHIRTSGRKLEIIPAKAFADSTTYHLVITSALQDLHGNALVTPYTLVFSTGSGLDSGTVSGCVIDPSKRTLQPTLALWRGQTTADTVIFRTPDYLTQTDSSGLFSIGNVRPGAYRLIAFMDQNGNRRFDPGSESSYAPLRPEIAVGKFPDTLLLFPASCDTAAPRLLAAKPVSPNLILCKWSAPLDSLKGYSDPAWSIKRRDGKKNAPAISETRWIGGKSRCALILADSLDLAPYDLSYLLRRKRGAASTVISDTMRFNGVRNADTVPPALVSAPPAGLTGLLPEIRLIFTEPVILSTPLSLTDSLHDTVPLSGSVNLNDTIVLLPKRRLHPGSRYRLLILRGFGKDLTGNQLKSRDSTDTVTSVKFSTVNADTLAVSLQGCAPCLTANTKRIWQFLPFSGTTPITAPDSNGCFRFDSLVSGKGFMGLFDDENGNGKPDRGTLIPFIAPEPYFVLSDTIEARARWEIEGISISACNRCRQPQVPSGVHPRTKKQ